MTWYSIYCISCAAWSVHQWHGPPAQGYFLGAFLFLGIVFSLPATLGMASLALDLPVRPGWHAVIRLYLYVWV
jgi:hypothetical protein